MIDNLHEPPLGADQGHVLWAWILYLGSVKSTNFQAYGC
jgi:hypothetical protein